MPVPGLPSPRLPQLTKSAAPGLWGEGLLSSRGLPPPHRQPLRPPPAPRTHPLTVLMRLPTLPAGRGSLVWMALCVPCFTKETSKSIPSHPLRRFQPLPRAVALSICIYQFYEPLNLPCESLIHPANHGMVCWIESPSRRETVPPSREVSALVTLPPEVSAQLSSQSLLAMCP